VPAHSDRAIVLQKGRVELGGAAADVAKDPALTKLLGV
jgi:ABC-type branched-subunit amino acid transport system ATPase component